MVKVFSGGYGTLHEWIDDATPVKELYLADVLVMPGGSDWNPMLYAEDKHRATVYDDATDTRQMDLMKRALNLNMPIIGICRGAQGLAILAGARLIQHQPSMGSEHELCCLNPETGEVETHITNSFHHQAAFPFILNEKYYKVYGWTENKMNYHEDGNHKEMSPPKECEIVYYPHIKGLGIQGHPESMSHDGRVYKPKYEGYVKYLNMLVRNFLNNKL